MKYLITAEQYRRVSQSAFTGLAPIVDVIVRCPRSQREIGPIAGLLDSGAEDTLVYKRDTPIQPHEVDHLPQTGQIVLEFEIAGEVYEIPCYYGNHPYAGTEGMLVGQDLLRNWRVTLNGPKGLLDVEQ